MKTSSSYPLLKFIYLTSQFLSGVSPPKKIFGPPPLGGKEKREPEEGGKSRRM